MYINSDTYRSGSLSFYKEELAGETKNYIHMRATAEQITPASALRALANEVLDCTHTVKMLAEDDTEFISLWELYVQVSEITQQRKLHLNILLAGP